MHGIEHCISGRPDASPVCSAMAVFSGYRFNAFWRAARASQMGPDARPGLSLACYDSRFRGFHNRVNVPGLLLRTLAQGFRCPFGFLAQLPASGSPRIGPLQRLKPVTASTLNSARSALGLRSPSGLLHPSGSKRSARFATNRPAFRTRPISSRSP